MHTFWKLYELDLQEVKLSYLNWAIGYSKEPNPRFRHLFLWDHQKEFCIVNSLFGRSFAISPFGLGVRGVPRPRYKGIPRGLDEIDIALKGRLGVNTGHIRSAIAKSLQNGNFNDARKMVQNYFWIKIGAHEILFDRIQLERDKFGKVRKSLQRLLNRRVMRCTI